jgi:hypothetical protein
MQRLSPRSARSKARKKWVSPRRDTLAMPRNIRRYILARSFIRKIMNFEIRGCGIVMSGYASLTGVEYGLYIA